MRSLPRTTPDLSISLLNLGRIDATGCPIHREGPSRDRPVWPCDATVASARDLRRGSPRCDESLVGCVVAAAASVIRGGGVHGLARAIMLGHQVARGDFAGGARRGGP